MENLYELDQKIADIIYKMSDPDNFSEEEYKKYVNLENNVMEDTGKKVLTYHEWIEWKSEWYEKLLWEMEGKIEDKLENVGKFIKSMEAEWRMYMEEARKLSQKSQIANNKAIRMKMYVDEILKKKYKSQIENGWYKMKAGIIDYGYRKSTVVANVDEEKLPKDFFQEVKETRLTKNKTELRKWYEWLDDEEKQKYKNAVDIQTNYNLQIK